MAGILFAALFHTRLNPKSQKNSRFFQEFNKVISRIQETTKLEEFSPQTAQESSVQRKAALGLNKVSRIETKTSRTSRLCFKQSRTSRNSGFLAQVPRIFTGLAYFDHNFQNHKRTIKNPRTTSSSLKKLSLEKFFSFFDKKPRLNSLVKTRNLNYSQET